MKLMPVKWLQSGTNIALPHIQVCENVLTHSPRSNAADSLLSPAVRVERHLPRTIEPELDPGFAIRLSRDLPQRYLVRLDDALLTGSDGMVVLPDGFLALELLHNDTRRVNDLSFVRQGLHGRAVKHKGDYFSLFMLWADSGNYYHWIHDAVMRLFEVLERLPHATRFIVPARLTGTQRESLTMLGIPPERCLPFDGTEIWQLEHLYFAPPSVHTGNDLPAADVWYRQAMWQAAGITAPGGDRRIHISRRNSRTRRFSNEPQVEQILSAHGFQTYCLEDFSFREQIALFAGAQVVVGCHGAGLTNLLFSVPGARVLDIQDPGYRNFAFWNMCEAVGHTYWYFLGDQLHDAPGVHEFRCPPEKLELTLSQMLSDLA